MNMAIFCCCSTECADFITVTLTGEPTECPTCMSNGGGGSYTINSINWTGAFKVCFESVGTINPNIVTYSSRGFRGIVSLNLYEGEGCVGVPVVVDAYVDIFVIILLNDDGQTSIAEIRITARSQDFFSEFGSYLFDFRGLACVKFPASCKVLGDTIPNDIVACPDGTLENIMYDGSVVVT